MNTRRPTRVMGEIIDAGCNFRRYRCRKCGLEWERFPSNAEEDAVADHYARHGTNIDGRRMCPRCNAPETFAAWGQARDEVSNDPT